MVIGNDDRGVVQPSAQQSLAVELHAEDEIGTDLFDDAGYPLSVGRLQRAVFHWVVPHVLRHAFMLALTAPVPKTIAGRTNRGGTRGCSQPLIST